jgi:hypothetical protein
MYKSVYGSHEVIYIVVETLVLFLYSHTLWSFTYFLQVPIFTSNIYPPTLKVCMILGKDKVY